MTEYFWRKLAGVDVNVANGLVVWRRAGMDLPGDGDGFAEIVLVLDPVEVDTQAGELSWFEVALF